MTKLVRLVSLALAVSVPIIIAHPALAATTGLPQVENFIESIIKIAAGLAGLVATGFFVVGGFRYITSSGNPINLERAKRTIIYSGIGLAITIAAFAISSIVTSLATTAFGS